MVGCKLKMNRAKQNTPNKENRVYDQEEKGQSEFDRFEFCI